MPTDIPPWLGDIHHVLAPQWAGVIVTFAAVLCGGAIGFERGRAQKPAGMRTLMLICLGSAIFTQASILMVEPGMDRTRIASGIVTGIGFLGAGAIIHERGLVIGVTTGAAIWATAAVGVIVGAGYIAAGACFSGLILVTLATAGKFEALVMGPCEHKLLRLTYPADSGKTRLAIQAILDENAHEGGITFTKASNDLEQADIPCCFSHRHHRSFLSQLMALPQIKIAQLD
jgi:putative Mg2+ transporter-C (MgtC) family protein